MASVTIVNPNDKAVDVRIVGKSGFLGLRGCDKQLHVAAQSVGNADMPKGTYHIRYQVDGSSVYEGDSFTLEENSVVAITLQGVSGGNYGIRPVGGRL